MIFKGRHFDRSVILQCVRWYLAYGLSLRDLKEMMAERGISIDPAMDHRRLSDQPASDHFLRCRKPLAASVATSIEGDPRPQEQ